ncbi:homoserine dehydrogenase [Geoalkalibacter ferrihydriticus]|uniref:Homoserine dehydrogenase n=2 Tax=Geoalkalibacter ferrihydriticus TaxID=392333 RepID=A0A0C2HX90_9BACT|nr:homoserine dehydrogenase [Geoalkalibacter ferrihydriticus]KIH77392.1 homoserine dehydrogenase [Geoalkalibacter ferrihydriticus DSM 17813]SDM16939.1 homoserine dehydrogenase [Geoalkalibacter ferrihydriticus]
MKEIKAGLIGLGTIGTGVVKVFQKNAELMEKRLGARLRLVKIADLDITTDRGISLDPALLTTDAYAVIRDPDIKIIIELIGGYEPARTFVLEAIAQGKHVITANKALLALHGDEILAAAEKQGVSVMFEAAVAGGIPVISAIKESLCANRFRSVLGILNGTCNYILSRMSREGQEFETVLKDAQTQGYAEADPTFDIEGVDTSHKLAILISLCFGTRVDFKSIYTEGISNISALDLQFAKQFGYEIKLLAIGKLGYGKVEARVHPTMIPISHPLADVGGVFNAVRLQGDFVGPVMLHGQGAGMDATASAVMGDAMAVTRDLLRKGPLRTPSMGCAVAVRADLPVRPMEELVGHYYLRVGVLDRPGVLAQIAGILGNHDISIASMMQPERQIGGAVPIVIMTHDAGEANVRAALAEIDQLELVREKSHLIRIENDLA